MILQRAFLRHLLRHPLQVVFGIVGIALGVAVVVSIDLANGSALRAFRRSAETISGRATDQVVGGPGGLPEGLYRRIRLEGGFRDCAPVVEGTVSVSSTPGFPLRLLGIDPLADGRFRSFTPGTGRGEGLSRFLTTPGAGFLLDTTARRLGAVPGSVLRLRAGGEPFRFLLLGTVSPADEAVRPALSNVAVVDIATAQEALGRRGRLSRIELILPDGEEGRRVAERIRRLLPPEADLVPAGARSADMEKMTSAFRINLSALSLLALVVGMFLVYNTMTFSVLSRREFIGSLRALGVTRREIFALVLSEASVLGAGGTILGILSGIALGEGLLHLVARTINDLYFSLDVRDVSVTPFSLAKGVGLGLGATLFSALAPAWEATTTPPRAALSRSLVETRLRRRVPYAAGAGALLLSAGASVFLVPRGDLRVSFTALFVFIVGYALAVPAALILLSSALRPAMGALFGILGRMAARGIVVSLSRTGVAAAALVVAVSATIGVGIMIGSFRLTVSAWLESTLRADFYFLTEGPSTDRDRPALSPSFLRRIEGVPGVAATSRGRHGRIFAEGRETVDLFAVDLPRRGFEGFRLKEGDPGRAWEGYRSGEVLVSEPYAWRHGTRAGDRIVLRTDRGMRSFRVGGVFYDYGSERGVVLISLSAYRSLWDDPAVDSLGIYLAPGASPSRVEDRLRERAGDDDLVVLYANRELRRSSMEIFDRTFAVTAVLRLLALLVAFVGILNALMAMQVERSRELAVLRANGLTPAQVWGLVVGETGLMGVVSGLLAVPLGIAQALALVLVVNRRSFGWTMQFHVFPGLLAEAFALALAAALLAGLYPAWRMSRTPPAQALREE